MDIAGKENCEEISKEENKLSPIKLEQKFNDAEIKKANGSSFFLDVVK